MDVNTAFKKLQKAFPWPEHDAFKDIRPWDYTLGGGGRHLIDDLILELPENPIMLEIGCFLCASSRRWLNLRDDLRLIGIDPWGNDLIDQCRRYVGRPALTRAYPDMATQQDFAGDIEKQGPYHTALANIKDCRERFVPIRGTSPASLYKLDKTGLAPHLIYIDADKKVEDLEASHQLWPDAIISGDDWHWGRTKGYPMRQIVTGFANKYSFKISADHATWVLRKEA